MIGIYKITNKINNKSYIGQSNNIKRRWQEHLYKRAEESRIPFSYAIEKYGADAFIFEVLEECSLEELSERETYWIKKYDTVKSGYNTNYGGDISNIGSNNGRSILSEKDIEKIRTEYSKKEKTTREVYKEFEDQVSYGHFMNIWAGKSWSHIMPEVFTVENKNYYSKETSSGEKSLLGSFTDEEVYSMRKRYVNETAKEIYKDYADRVSYQGLQSILWGRHYKNVPIYSKKNKKWKEL